MNKTPSARSPIGRFSQHSSVNDFVEAHLHQQLRAAVGRVKVSLYAETLLENAYGFVSGNEDGFLFELFSNGDRPARQMHNLLMAPGGRMIRRKDYLRVEGILSNGARFRSLVLPHAVGVEGQFIALLSLQAGQIDIRHNESYEMHSVVGWSGGHPAPQFLGLATSVKVHRGETLIRSEGNRNWDEYEVADFKIEICRESEELGYCCITRVAAPKNTCEIPLLDALKASGRALSLLFGYIVESWSYSLHQGKRDHVQLRPPSPAGKWRPIVPADCEAERSLVIAATRFFLFEPKEITDRFWAIVEPVLSAVTDRENVLRRALACEGLAGLAWAKYLNLPRKQFKMAGPRDHRGAIKNPPGHLEQVLASRKQIYSEQELDAWRTVRDWTVHDDDQIYEFSAQRHFHHRFLIDSLYCKLLLGILGYAGRNIDHATMADAVMTA